MRTQSFLTQMVTDVDGPVPGDCWRTAVGCLVGAPAAEVVPHFVAIDRARGNESSTRWWHDTVAWVDEWLAGDGDYEGVALRLLQPTFPVYASAASLSHQCVIATGQSPRGDWLHSVLVNSATGALVWDPHPTRAGLVGPPLDIAALVNR